MTGIEQLPLRDIHLPEPVSWWPPAVGWWLLAAVLSLVIAGAWWRFRAGGPRRRERRLRTVAAGELDRLAADYERDADPGKALAALSVLLRRAAITLGGRTRLAGLTGPEWIEWLDASDVGGAFDAESLGLLAAGPYQRDPGGDVDALIRASRRWLETFRPGAAAHDPV